MQAVVVSRKRCCSGDGGVQGTVVSKRPWWLSRQRCLEDGCVQQTLVLQEMGMLAEYGTPGNGRAQERVLCGTVVFRTQCC